MTMSTQEPAAWTGQYAFGLPEGNAVRARFEQGAARLRDQEANSETLPIEREVECQSNAVLQAKLMRVTEQMQAQRTEIRVREGKQEP